MTAYLPPTDDLAIFDPSVFLTDDDTLTQTQADNRYCLYPNVQGSLNLINASINGILDMSNNNITNINQISCDSAETNITALNRINQSLSVGTDNSSVTGFYSKAKDVFPALQSNATALKAVTNFNYQTNLPNTNSYSCCCWCPFFRKFVILASNGSPNRGFVSDDGIIFTATSINNSSDWQNVCFIPEINRVVAVANSGTFRIQYSDNLTTWTTPTTTPAFQNCRGIAYSPQLKKLVVTCIDGVQRIWVSNDYGVTWSLRQVPAQNQWINVCWCDTLGLFVAVSAQGTPAIMISKNGDNWYTVSPPADNTSILLRDVCFSRSLGIIVASGVSSTDTSKRMIYSYNGIDWFSGSITSSSSDSRFFRVRWSPQLKVFVAVSNVSTGASTLRWIYSFDGINWTPVSTLGNDDSWWGLDWSEEMSTFLAVGHPNSGTMNNRVMMSSLKARLPTANNFFGNINNNDISENGNWLINFRNIKVDTRVRIGGTASILSGTASGSSGIFLNVNINGNPYKIQLLNA